ncbi:MAG: response regulator transcription factor [Gemmatimonadetes bacterium]|nr:response regulator transcription factor [Gemmatimonadota bacterium]
MPGNAIRILLVDDHAVLRAGLRALLEAEDGLEVVGEAGTGEEGVEMADRMHPDVVVMDLSMPGIGGLEATRRIAAMSVAAAGADGVQAVRGATRVLVLTMHGEEEHLLPVLEAGGSGYVNKRGADEELIEAIRTVARGDVFLYPNAAKLLLQGFRGKAARGEEDPIAKLTERELEVLGYTAEGFSSAEIGKKLFISPKTVDTYRSRIMEKLGLHHRSELVRFALQQGLLKPE